MLLDEDPATLIHHTINNFNIHPDKHAIARVQESIGTLHQARDLRITETVSALKKLSRTLHTMQEQHTELTASHSSTAHASEISRLDTQKFRTAKAASDLEMETERLANQLADLNSRLQELEVQGAEGGDYHSAGGGGGNGQSGALLEDEVLLRLKIYRSLGIDLERDDVSKAGAGKDEKGLGEFTRAVVRNDRKGDVRIVNMDKKFSRFFYANYFWGAI